MSEIKGAERKEHDVTRKTLLASAQRGDESAWREVVAIYQPMIKSWLGRFGVAQQEIDDLTQEVLVLLLKGLNGFKHQGNPGAFRNWLRTLSINRARSFWRMGKGRPHGRFSMNLQEMADELEDPNSNLSLQWDQEHDRHVMQLCLERIAKEVSPQTMQAFQLHALEELPAKTVADKLGITPVAVYGAKARVMTHLRKMAGDLLE